MSRVDSVEYDQLAEELGTAAGLGYAVSYPADATDLSEPSVEPAPTTPPRERNYLIIGDAHGLLLLVARDGPHDGMEAARTFDPATGTLGPVQRAGQYLKFIPSFQDYTGSQDALDDVLPDEIDFAMEEDPAPTRAPCRPDTDTMTRWLRGIVLGMEKPDHLDEMESEAYDRLAAEVAEIERRGHIVEIPPE